jgi:hypothetical protein
MANEGSDHVESITSPCPAAGLTFERAPDQPVMPEWIGHATLA